MASIAEQITALEATRAAKTARMGDVQSKASDEGRTKDEAEREEFATLRDEIGTIDAELVDLHEIEKMNGHRALAVIDGQRGVARPNNGRGNGANYDAAPQQQARVPAQPIRTPPHLEPGVGFAQVVKCIASCRGNLMQAAEFSRHLFGDQSDVTQSVKGLSRIGSSNSLDMITRGAVSGAVTTDADWAGPLAFPYPRLATEFIEFLRPRTVLGRIPGMTQIPFNVNIAAQTSGATASWVGEGAGKPVTAWAYTSVNFRWAKIAAIVVQTEELLRFSSPSSDTLFRDELVKAVAERQDLDFLDPSNTGTANIKPVAVTQAVAKVVSLGNTGDHVRQDVEALFAKFDAANITPVNPVFVMSVTKARALSLMMNALGQPEFPGITLNGDGNLLGIPIVSSQYITRFGTTGGEYVILINPSDIYFADDGQVTVDASREASIMMDDTPTDVVSGGTGASMVSMWQNNAVAVRAERYVNWQLRRAAGVQVLSNVFWGHASASGT